MAESDYNVADRRNADGTIATDGTATPLEAGDKVAQTVQATPDQDARDFAVTNNVSQAAYANYATALNAHASRADIESLADRRARGQGDAFADADFMRAEVYDPATGDVNAPPRAGTVEGDAPASA